MKFVVRRPVPWAWLRYAQAGCVLVMFVLVPTLGSWTRTTHGNAGKFQALQQTAGAGPVEEEACDHPPLVNSALLGNYGCKMLGDSCLDQGRILLHTGEKTPGHPNWTDEPIFSFEIQPTIVLPGYPEPLGTVHHMPASKFALDIRAPTPLDPPDVWRPPRFSNCTLPLVFQPWYFSIFGEVFIHRVTPFVKMVQEGVIDRDVTLVMDTNGMNIPSFYQPLMEPCSRHKVQSLQDFSSRERAAEGRSRCYSRLLLCNIPPWFYEHKVTGTKIKEYYKEKHPEKFERPPADKGVFRVAFINRSSEAQGGMRRIVNLGEALEQCRRWQLPPESKFERVECLALEDFTPERLPDTIAQMQRVHALVGTHGSGMVNGYFLPSGSAVVEIMCHNFCGDWPNGYHRLGMENDQSVASGYFRITADKEHCLPGPFERNNTGSTIAYARDQDIRVTFDPLATVLHRIALGQVHSEPGNWKHRVFNMTGEGCPPEW